MGTGHLSHSSAMIEIVPMTTPGTMTLCYWYVAQQWRGDWATAAVTVEGVEKGMTRRQWEMDEVTLSDEGMELAQVWLLILQKAKRVWLRVVHSLMILT